MLVLTEPSLQQVRALGLATIDAIEWCGWTQGINQDPDGKVCLNGAINLAASDGRTAWDPWRPTTPLEMRVIVKALRAALRQVTHRGAMQWNDMPGRTKEQVIWTVAEAIGVDPEIALYG